jgi:hypothetical protein
MSTALRPNALFRLAQKMRAWAWLRRLTHSVRPTIARNTSSAVEYLVAKGNLYRPLIGQLRSGIIRFHPIRVIDINSDPRIVSPDFVYECAWFTRYCFTVQGPDRAAALLAGFPGFIAARLPPRACARKTIHLLWDSSTPISPDLLRHLTAVSKDVNIKLVVFAVDSQVAEIGKMMEEVCPDEAQTKPRPTPVALLTNWLLRKLKNK